MTSENPYAPPALEAVEQPKKHHAGAGPALYIAIGGVSAAMVAPGYPQPILKRLVFAWLGCVTGGFVFRWVSRQWPIDESARLRQVIWSVIVLTAMPAGMALVGSMGGEPIRPLLLLGLIVASGLVTAIVISGNRRNIRRVAAVSQVIKQGRDSA